MLRKISLLLLFYWSSLASSEPLYAQLNAIAGYEFFRADVPQYNELLETVNVAQVNPEKLASTIRLLHGFSVGGRYNYSLGAVELVYRRSLTRRRGLEYRFKDVEEFFDSDGMVMIRDINIDVSTIDFSYNMAAWSLNFEFGKGVIVGGSIDYNILSQKVKYDGIAPADGFRSFKGKQFSWGNRVYLGINIENSSEVSFSLRPFYQWHWTATSLTQLRDQLLVTSEVCEHCLEQPSLFGISLVIKNGPQD